MVSDPLDMALDRRRDEVMDLEELLRRVSRGCKSLNDEVEERRCCCCCDNSVTLSNDYSLRPDIEPRGDVADTMESLLGEYCFEAGDQSSPSTGQPVISIPSDIG